MSEDELSGLREAAISFAETVIHSVEQEGYKNARTAGAPVRLSYRGVECVVSPRYKAYEPEPGDYKLWTDFTLELTSSAPGALIAYHCERGTLNNAWEQIEKMFLDSFETFRAHFPDVAIQVKTWELAQAEAREMESRLPSAPSAGRRPL